MKRTEVVGGGLVCLAKGFKILLKLPGITLQLFEKEVRTGQHQAGRNIDVLLFGLYYQPDLLKVKVAVKGIREISEFY